MPEGRLHRTIVRVDCTLTLALLVSVSAAAQQEAFCPSTEYQSLPEQWTAVAPVRPIFPQSGAWLDYGTVDFAWAPALPATVELSRSRFFFGVAYQIKGIGAASGPVALADGVWFWRIRPEGFAQPSVAWSLQVAPSPSMTHGGVGLAVGTDFDGDGLVDTIAPRDILMLSLRVPIETSNERHATLWSAHHSGCPVLEWFATAPDPKCGIITKSWAAGDVNGDGHGDVVSIDLEKNLYLFLGKDTLDVPRNLTPSRLLRSGALAIYRDSRRYDAGASYKLAGRGPGTPRTVAHGDFNGDGYADIVDGWYVTYGAADDQPTRTLPLNWQSAVAFTSGCDINGDRFVDVATLSEEGRLSIYLGGAAGLSTSPYLAMPWASATSVASSVESTTNPLQLVDLDSDGYCDVVSMFPSTSRLEFAEILVLSGRTVRNGKPKVDRYNWHRAATKGSVSWVAVPKAYRDKSPMFLVYDTAPFSIAFRHGILEPGQGLRQDSFYPRIFGGNDEVAHHYELYISGDINGDGRLDIANNEIMYAFYGGPLKTGVADGNGNFETIGSLQWGGPEQGFFVFFHDAK